MDFRVLKRVKVSRSPRDLIPREEDTANWSMKKYTSKPYKKFEFEPLLC